MKLKKKLIIFIVFLSVGLLVAIFGNDVLKGKPPKQNENYDKIISLIKENYVDLTRLKPSWMLLNAVVSLSNQFPEVYVVSSSEDADKVNFKLSVQGETIEVTLRNGQGLKGLVDALNYIENFTAENLIKPENSDKIQLAMANGFLSALDPHSDFFSQQVLEKFNEDSQGSFGGVGIFIEMIDNKVQVVSPMADSPAEKAGLFAHDVIVKVEGVPVLGLDLSEVVSMIRGEIGSYVTLSISRAGWDKERDFKIERGKIFNTLDYYSFERPEGRIGYIRFRRFSNEASDNILFALEKLGSRQSDFKGLVLDLRNNPGGFLEQAIKASDIFLDSGMIVATGKTKDKLTNHYNAGMRNSRTDFPMVVLINQNSASASEIMAAALKHNGRALLIGGNTFGKGSVQTIFNMAQGTGLKLTIAQYFTAGLHSIQSVGVSPHVSFNNIVPKKSDFLYLDTIKAFGEGRLKNAFQWGEEQDKPLASVTHALIRDPSNDAATNIRNGINLSFLDIDPLFQFAVQALEAGDRLKGADFVSKSLELVNPENQKQLHLFSDELQKQSISWDPSFNDALPGKASIALQCKLLKKSGDKFIPVDKGYVFKPSESGEVRITVTNKGDALKNFVLLAESTDNRFNNKELPFGLLEAGATAEQPLPFEVRGSQLGEVIPLKFKPYSGHKTFGEHAEDCLVRTQGAEPPLYSLKVLMKSKSASEGELQITVSNLSETTAGQPFVRVASSGRSNVRLDHFLFKPGVLPAGESTTDVISFSGLDTANAEPLKFNFRLFDSEFSVAGILRDEAFKDGGGFFISPVQIALETLPMQTKDTEVLLKGRITDDEEVRYYYLYVGEEKQSFSMADSDKRPQDESFKIKAKLKAGQNNLIRLIAEDNQGNSSIKSAWVWSGDVRVPPPEEEDAQAAYK